MLEIVLEERNSKIRKKHSRRLSVVIACALSEELVDFLRPLQRSRISGIWCLHSSSSIALRCYVERRTRRSHSFWTVEHQLWHCLHTSEPEVGRKDRGTHKWAAYAWIIYRLKSGNGETIMKLTLELLEWHDDDFSYPHDADEPPEWAWAQRSAQEECEDWLRLRCFHEPGQTLRKDRKDRESFPLCRRYRLPSLSQLAVTIG